MSREVQKQGEGREGGGGRGGGGEGSKEQGRRGGERIYKQPKDIIKLKHSDSERKREGGRGHRMGRWIGKERRVKGN